MPSIKYFQRNDNVKNKFSFKSVLLGIVGSLIITLILITLSSAILLYSSVPQKFIPAISKIILLIAVFVGGMMSGIKSNASGWLYGVLSGTMFFLLLLLLNIFLGIGIEYTVAFFVTFFACILVGSIGGVVGINMKPRRKH